MYVIIGCDAFEPSHNVGHIKTTAVKEQEVYMVGHYDHFANLCSLKLLGNSLYNLLYHLSSIIQPHLTIVNRSK